MMVSAGCTNMRAQGSARNPSVWAPLAFAPWRSHDGDAVSTALSARIRVELRFARGMAGDDAPGGHKDHLQCFRLAVAVGDLQTPRMGEVVALVVTGTCSHWACLPATP